MVLDELARDPAHGRQAPLEHPGRLRELGLELSVLRVELPLQRLDLVVEVRRHRARAVLLRLHRGRLPRERIALAGVDGGGRHLLANPASESGDRLEVSQLARTIPRQRVDGVPQGGPEAAAARLERVDPRLVLGDRRPSPSRAKRAGSRAPSDELARPAHAVARALRAPPPLRRAVRDPPGSCASARRSPPGAGPRAPTRAMNWARAGRSPAARRRPSP